MPIFTAAPNASPGSHQRQTKTLLWIGFGGLLLLMCLLSASSLSFLYEIEVRHENIRQEYVKRDRVLERLRSVVYLSGTYFRDYVMEGNDESAARERVQFLAARAEAEARLSEYERLTGATGDAALQQLRAGLAAYFEALAPALSWTTRERQAGATSIIQGQMLPRRVAAIGFCDRLQQSNERRLERNSQAVSEMFSSFRTRLLLLSLLTVTIGTGLATATMWRLLHLERISDASFREVAGAREELRQLSAELLEAQENERRRISRELHDEVGQVLSAMMLGIGNVRSSLMKQGGGDAILRQVQLIEDMTERSARVVRNLSLVLRPTMLDDLGLIAALKWLARETSRNSALQVEVLGEEAPDELPEEHRTCVYRVVQETLRNVSRHSGAHHALITLEMADARLRIAVQDDGKGFRPDCEKGMGILGMEERVDRLGGSLHISSGAGRGTKLTFELPVPERIGNSAEPDQETSPFRTA